MRLTERQRHRITSPYTTQHTVPANENHSRSLKNHSPVDTVKKANVHKPLYLGVLATSPGTGDAICLSRFVATVVTYVVAEDTVKKEIPKGHGFE